MLSEKVNSLHLEGKVGWGFYKTAHFERISVALDLAVQVVWNGLGIGLALGYFLYLWGLYHCPCWNGMQKGLGLTCQLTSFCLLQGKRHRESEDSKSCRRPSDRSPTSAEKRMSFESVSSLPEVSSKQMGGR